MSIGFNPVYHFEDLNLKEITAAGKVTKNEKMIADREDD